MSSSRAENRVQRTNDILRTSKELLALRGPAGLSLREVARELNLSSSAIYRYVATRDELLTLLILDSYNELGGAVEKAEARVARRAYRERLTTAARAIRRWSLEHPHQYALIYGSPIPDYHAPQETVAAASRVIIVLGSIIRDATQQLESVPKSDSSLEWETLRSVLGNVSDDVVMRSLMCWTQIFGTISFELFGHYVGSVRRYDRYFDSILDRVADDLGLTNS